MMPKRLIPCSLVVLAMVVPALADSWAPKPSHLETPWTALVTSENPLPDYPRPQLVREGWKSLNGLWDYSIQNASAEEEIPREWEGKILVPFPVESSLSGVKRRLGAGNEIWYRTELSVPPEAQGERLLLNFGAVDWRATVYLDGEEVGRHEGGYTPFTIDLTNAVEGSGRHQLIVRAWDPTDQGSQPRGKQVTNPKGIWYTAVSGIWQTVWMEWVPQNYVTSLQVSPDVDGGTATFVVDTSLEEGEVSVSVVAEGAEIATASGESGEPIAVAIPNPTLWSPEKPFLYDVVVQCGDDIVKSYFGMRKVAMQSDSEGHNRIFLNNKPLFELGLLDQGWWPDGLYTAPTDEALRWDIQTAKSLGFNLLRKHVKVEPARWYYWADRLGVLIWQDQPNFGQLGGGGRTGGDASSELLARPEVRETYRREFSEMVRTLQGHPSIVVWVPFNEGWGQHETNETIEWVRKLDPTRLVDGPSGWHDMGVGDLLDLHGLSSHASLPERANRATVLGEFAGVGKPVAGHEWGKESWGYQNIPENADFLWTYERLMGAISRLIPNGLSAAVYTQLTDVENEATGLVTYDRRVVKVPVEEVESINRGLIDGSYHLLAKPLSDTSEETPQVWRYVTEMPASSWAESDFDDSGWSEGVGGFGRMGTPGAVVGTNWRTSDIWIRRSFELDLSSLNSPYLRVYHDEDAEIFINGVQVASFPDYENRYVEIPLNMAARSALVEGRNVIAAHCRQTTKGQNLDVGLFDRIQAEKLP